MTILMSKTVALPFGNEATFAWDDAHGPLGGVKTPIRPAKSPHHARRLSGAYVRERAAFFQEVADTLRVEVVLRDASLEPGRVGTVKEETRIVPRRKR